MKLEGKISKLELPQRFIKTLDFNYIFVLKWNTGCILNA